MTARRLRHPRRRPRLESREEFEARLEREKARFRNPVAASHGDVVRSLEQILELHRQRREQQSADDHPLTIKATQRGQPNDAKNQAD